MELFEQKPELGAEFLPKWSEYIPHWPSSKQFAFLMLPHLEALFGGAAGGGKSDALLMAALQYVNVPNYSAIIFRKTYQDLKEPGALIDRSLQWLKDTDARWNNTTHIWTFPSGAKLAFGYLQTAFDHYNYMSAEFQYIAFDESTQIAPKHYTFMFSRLRKPQCAEHKEFNADCRICIEYEALREVPLRVRAATNPGGYASQWIKERFNIKKTATGWIGTDPEKPFIPSKLEDNPALNAEEYRESLSNLDPVTRRQLLEGDWGATEEGRLKQSWLRYYSSRGAHPEVHIVLGKDGKGESIPIRECRCAQFVDPAASVREGPGDEQIYVRKRPSWTVIGTFLITPPIPYRHLIWWRCLRFQKEVPDVVKGIASEFRDMHKEWRIRPEFIGIERDGLGIGVYQSVDALSLPVQPLQTQSRDKLVRATDVLNLAEKGRFWLPQTAGWLEPCEIELTSWTGHPDEEADQIDVAAYAGMWVTEMAEDILARQDIPEVI